LAVEQQAEEQQNQTTENAEPTVEYSNQDILVSLNDEFREIAEKNLHVVEYLREVLSRGGTLPEYRGQLTSSMRGEKVKGGIIYPIGDPLFIHMYMDESGARAVYNPVEPIIPVKGRDLMHATEEAVAFRITSEFHFESAEEQSTKLREILGSVVSLNERNQNIGEYVYDNKKRMIETNSETYKAL